MLKILRGIVDVLTKEKKGDFLISKEMPKSYWIDIDIIHFAAKFEDKVKLYIFFILTMAHIFLYFVHLLVIILI